MLASLTLTLALAAADAAPAEAPHWEADYGKALKQTRADDRPLLVVIDKPGVEKEQFGDAMLGKSEASYLKAYDLCRVNGGSEYGERVAKAFGAEKFPYLAIIDKTGSVILHSRSGELTTDAWRKTLEKHQSGERVVRHTVAKPVTASSTPVYYSPSQSSAVVGDCPNCRRGY